MSPSHSRSAAARAGGNARKGQVRAAQNRLLYENANTGLAVTVFVAPLLAYFQLPFIPYRIVAVWLLYIVLVSAARFMLVKRYRRTPNSIPTDTWIIAFALGAGLAGIGWGAAGIVLY